MISDGQAGPAASADRLASRFDALGRFLRTVGPHLDRSPVPGLDPNAVPAARQLVARARARLELAAGDRGGYTVVALAGATGSGKSSLFNALAGLELSPPGALRPTTDEVHACVWGGGEGAPALLDWLGVSPARRFRRESVLDAEDEAALRGLVLLDLPDLDSIASAHRIEAERLVGAVDLVIWVLDPQKYADASVHDGYLRHMGAVRDVTVVVLNQIDRLRPADAARCLDDLTTLVAADGLPGVAVIGASAATGAGVGQIRVLLERTVASRSAALARLEGELDETVTTLAPLVGESASAVYSADPGPAVHPVDPVEERVSRDAVLVLAGEFASAAGVSAVAAEAGREYAGRAAVPGWPLNRSRVSRMSTVDRLGSAEVPPADPAALNLAVRRLAATSAAGLPAPWPDEVRVAATAGREHLPDELGQAVRAARPRPPSAAGWWLVRIVWWLALAGVLAGVAGLVWSAVSDTAPSWPTVGGRGLPVVLIVAGLIVAVVLSVVGRWIAAARAKRWRAAAERRLSGAAASVAREAVAPVRAALRDYDEARAAFQYAAHGPVG